MIKTEDIKRLLDRYYDGMTTEEEEKVLHTYFNGSDIDASLTEERIFFTALQSLECPTPAGIEERLSRQISQWNTLEVTNRRAIRHINLRWVVGIAASLLLLLLQELSFTKTRISLHKLNWIPILTLKTLTPKRQKH